MSRFGTVFLFFVLLSSTANAAPIGAVTDLGNRLDRLERDITTLQRNIYRGGSVGGENIPAPAIPVSSAESEVRFTEIDEQMRDMHGRVEKLEFTLRTMDEKIEAILTMLKQPATEAIQLPSAMNELDATEPISNSGTLSSDQQAMQQYNMAFGLLRQARYADAEAALSQFIAQHPENDLTGNAYYWLGETHYVQKNYDKAAVQFLEGYQKFPSGSKAADNLLKLAFSLSNLGKAKESCATFSKLAKEFPDAPKSIRQRADAEYSRLQCK